MSDEPNDSRRDGAAVIKALIRDGTRPKACPLCGGEAYAYCTVNGTQMFKVGCAACGLELKAAWYRDQDKPTKDILTLWNTRADSGVPRSGVPEFDAERALREEWWANHGCAPSAQYGDDSEMQCNALGCMHDFKREPLATLAEYVYDRRLRRAIESTAEARAGQEPTT
jgi:hypothetical protein